MLTSPSPALIGPIHEGDNLSDSIGCKTSNTSAGLYLWGAGGGGVIRPPCIILAPPLTFRKFLKFINTYSKCRV